MGRAAAPLLVDQAELGMRSDYLYDYVYGYGHLCS